LAKDEEKQNTKRRMVELLCYASWVKNIFPEEIKKLGRKELRNHFCYSGKSRITKVDNFFKLSKKEAAKLREMTKRMDCRLMVNYEREWKTL
jgi:archaeosine-15-forming tRNA-guanine transglycosylase